MRISRDSLKLYAVTDRTWHPDRSLTVAVEGALAGGATLVQLREKDLPNAEFQALAVAVKTVCQKYQVPLIINDNIEVARLSNADGVHIGQDDDSVEAARRALGAEKIIGVSVQTVEQALAAEQAGADYLGVGAVFTTATKTDAAAVSLDTLKSITAAVTIPVCAIGGIGLENIGQLAGTGIDGVAVVSAIFASKDTEAAARELGKMLGGTDLLLPVSVTTLNISVSTLNNSVPTQSSHVPAFIAGPTVSAIGPAINAGTKIDNISPIPIVPPIKGAIFDLDGTLLDSMWLWDTVGSSYLASLGFEVEPDVDTRFKSMSMDQSAQYIKDYCQLEQSTTEIMQEIDNMISSYYSDVFKLKPGIAELLEKLSNVGIKMCVASLTNGYLIEAALQNNNIRRYFSQIFSCRDLGISKHEPQIYQIAQRYLGFESQEILVFEDAPFAIKTAKDAGFVVVGVEDPSYQENLLERRQWADYFVENGDFEQVLEALGIAGVLEALD